ncbi:CarboxypepD_reg-like domain-containing protein [Prevotella communis]|uniref:CarboxypepD_reg-like domain-containing protein n=2 Tax=Prevotella communis TaxID=2913614 RepID=A0A1G8AHX3_9BACT|nr:CarboxypepD_reg-like domain-containing protein [Prevotella communis]
MTTWVRPQTSEAYLNMKGIRLFVLIYTLLLGMAIHAQQSLQITGVITDEETGDSISFASIVYKGHNISTVANVFGQYTIPRQEGWNITVSAVGYKSRIIPVNSKTRRKLNITLKPARQELAEVTVKSRRNRYSRKDNPAVELMRRVVAAKKKTDLSNNDYYRYNKYEKLTLALNDLTPQQLESPFFAKKPWLLNQVEVNSYTNKLVLPVSVDETVSQKFYRKSPKDEKNIIQGQTSTGINDYFQTGDIINTVVKDVFTNVDLYQDDIRILQRPFTSPMSEKGIGFYRYYIEDTLAIGQDSCIHLAFVPNNMQDMGFRGDLYILKDSTLHLRRCQLSIPKQSNVNFVESLQVLQEYEKLPDGQWVLTTDDMITELQLFDFISAGAIVTRITRYSDYDFSEVPNKIFHGQKKEVTEADAQMRDKAFWDQYRQVELTRSENSMDKFMENIQNMKGFKYIIYGLKTLMENSMETGDPNYIDICPINTLLTRNYVDGWRTRLSAKTTANLNKHFFLSGYYAHGWGSHRNYYDAEMTYSLNAKKYLPHEFPRRTMTIQSSQDICSPNDRFMESDKDNIFVAMKWAETNKMMSYNRQKVSFEYETDWGLKAIISGKTEENEAFGAMNYQTLDKPFVPINSKTGNGEYLRTTEASFYVRYAPGETYINNKLRRRVINLDAPVFSLSHTIGFNGVLGGDYNFHLTEAHIFKRFWLNSWGKFDVDLKGGIEWDQVPYPLLIMPASNASFIIQKNTFSLINTMEFVNDRYVSLMLAWDMNGKILNRIPLAKKLYWREYLGVRMLWGDLSDKNNPEKNPGNPRLMYFPDGTNIMNPNRPYMEMVVGVHNIFKFFRVEYVKRLTYKDLPSAPHWGMRYGVSLTF